MGGCLGEDGGAPLWRGEVMRRKKKKKKKKNERKTNERKKRDEKIKKQVFFFCNTESFFVLFSRKTGPFKKETERASVSGTHSNAANRERERKRRGKSAKTLFARGNSRDSFSLTSFPSLLIPFLLSFISPPTSFFKRQRASRGGARGRWGQSTRESRRLRRRHRHHHREQARP